MTPPEPRKFTVPPGIDELFNRFLQQTAIHPELHESSDSEVELHETIGEFHADTAVLWNEAQLVFGLMGIPSDRISVPPEWKAFTRFANTTIAPPMAAGFVPQRVRGLECWLEPDSRLQTQEPESTLPELPRMAGWIEKQSRSSVFALRMLAAGLMCNLGQSSVAIELLQQMQATLKPEEKFAWRNQLAAAYWTSGNHAAAVQEWQQLPESGVTLFNLGLAAFILGQTEEARQLLTQAGEALPETSGWSHLAELLLVVSE